MILAAITMALASQGAVMLDRRTSVDLTGPAIRIRDVVPAMMSRREGGVEIARVPAGRRAVTLSRRAVAALVRRAEPGLVVGGDQAGTITFRVAASSAGRNERCFVMLAPVAQGAAIMRADVGQGICGDGTVPVRYDSQVHAIVATRRLTTGESIGRALPAVGPDVVRGDALTLVARSGPVTIERSVTALQPGRNGGRVFVRDGAGQIFAAPVAGADR